MKVKLEINEQLLRGVLLDREKEKEDGRKLVEEEGKTKKKHLLWCRF